MQIIAFSQFTLDLTLMVSCCYFRRVCDLVVLFAMAPALDLEREYVVLKLLALLSCVDRSLVSIVNIL